MAPEVSQKLSQWARTVGGVNAARSATLQYTEFTKVFVNSPNTNEGSVIHRIHRTAKRDQVFVNSPNR